MGRLHAQVLRTAAFVCSIGLLAVGCTDSTSLTDDVPGTTEFVDTNGTDPNPEMSEPGPANWELDPAWPLTPESTTLHLLVVERACASGISAEGRIEATTTFSATEVEVEVIVNSVGGYANCPGNPTTPFVLELTEPLGDRTVVGEDPILD